MIADWLDPAGCPAARPPLAEMAPETRALHEALDAHAPWLHPTRRTIQRDLLGSPEVVAWQEAKAAFLIDGEGAWSELPHLYARYGTPGVAALIRELRALEGAAAAIVTDSGMQAVALVIDALVQRGGHAVAMRQVYNKTRTFLEHSAARVGATVTLVDDGDLAGLAAAIRPETRLVIAETFTNPLVRAQDVGVLARLTPNLVLDTTIATPWGLRMPALASGARVVVGSLTKALGGEDTALGGYIATNDAALGNQLMDLVAMRGGILDDARARTVAAHLPAAERDHARRCATASAIAAFLARHPRVERTWHPSLPDHPDAAVIARDYVRPGSLLSFRVANADELGHRRIADALASTGVPRYALSFDGLATKVNHHKTVSEYFTLPEVVAANGIDRLIRVGVGLEAADDLIACLDWALEQPA
ncbi:MAG TPA: PLP-dependent transferase [Kofleriaceae bacterium]